MSKKVKNKKSNNGQPEKEDGIPESLQFAILRLAEEKPCGCCDDELLQMFGNDTNKIIMQLQKIGVLAYEYAKYILTKEGWEVYALIAA